MNRMETASTFSTPKMFNDQLSRFGNSLKKKNNLTSLGVIISDSHTTLLRRGVLGIGLAWCGFKVLNNYIGKPDCFGNPLQYTQVNVLDSLTVAAVFCMGEGGEQTPLAVIKEVKNVEFQDNIPSEVEIDEFFIPMKDDLYSPLWDLEKWKLSSNFPQDSIKNNI